MVRPARRLPATLLLALIVLGAGACGSGGDKTATSTATTTAAAAAPAKGRYTAKQVARIAGFTQTPGGTWTSPTGCTVTMILLTHEAVVRERTSQDALVVSNSRDDVGVKFDLKAGCREALLANLSQVK
jgi:hypothetical protein